MLRPLGVLCVQAERIAGSSLGTLSLVGSLTFYYLSLSRHPNLHSLEDLAFPHKTSGGIALSLKYPDILDTLFLPATGSTG